MAIKCIDSLYVENINLMNCSGFPENIKPDHCCCPIHYGPWRLKTRQPGTFYITFDVVVFEHAETIGLNFH